MISFYLKNHASNKKILLIKIYMLHEKKCINKKRILLNINAHKLKKTFSILGSYIIIYEIIVNIIYIKKEVILLVGKTTEGYFMGKYFKYNFNFLFIVNFN